MEAAFIQILNISITASYLVLVIILLRMIFKKAPKSMLCTLWFLVAIRLVCPFSFESVLSLVPSVETIPQDILYAEQPTIHSGIPYLNSTVNPIISESLAPDVGDSVNPTKDELILITEDDFHYIYRFTTEDGKHYIFDADNSSCIPSYQYAEGENAKCPVPDGAIFEVNTQAELMN